MATNFLTGDDELDEARADVLFEEQQRCGPAGPVGAAAETAIAMQNQHVADEVKESARRNYLEMDEDGEITPFDQYTVVELLTQMANGTNYFFKIQIADSPAEFVQLRVHHSLFGEDPQLVALRKGEEAAGPLEYWERGDDPDDCPAAVSTQRTMEQHPQAPQGLFAQCAPVTQRIRPTADESPICTLHYFGMKGRGEVIRLMLEEAAVPYDSVTHWVGPAWLEVKSEMPLGMLPVLEVPGGHRIAQSGTIIRYLAQVTGMDAGPDLLDRAQTDMLYETAVELKELKAELGADAEHATLQALMAGKAGNQKWTKLVSIVTALERQLEQSGGEYFVGGQLCYADLAVFNTLNYLEEVAAGCLVALSAPRLAAFREAITQRPRVASYLASDRCYPFTELEVLTPGFRANGVPMGLKYVYPLKDAQWQQPLEQNSHQMLKQGSRQHLQ